MWYEWFKKNTNRSSELNDIIKFLDRSACNYCVNKILYDNNIITITNIDGKIINCDNKHPILRWINYFVINYNYINQRY